MACASILSILLLRSRYDGRFVHSQMKTNENNADFVKLVIELYYITGMDPHWGFGGVATPPKILGNFRKFWEILNFLER